MSDEMRVESQPADFGSRFSAFMIDGVLLFLAQWAIVIVISRQLQAVGLTSTWVCDSNEFTGADIFCEGPTTGLWALLLVFLLTSTVAYYAVFEGRYGATPGKRLQGLRVVDEQDDSPVGAARGFVRSMVRQVFFLLPFFLLDASPIAIPAPPILALLMVAAALVMLAMAALRKDSRAAHDLVAGTRVVRDASAQTSDHVESAIVPEFDDDIEQNHGVQDDALQDGVVLDDDWEHDESTVVSDITASS